MPGRDKKGPEGMGPMTGRGMGNCDNTNASMPIGCMRGRGNRFRQSNRAMGFRGIWSLDEEKKHLELQKESIERRLSELEK